jgi:hypothetical protein
MRRALMALFVAGSLSAAGAAAAPAVDPSAPVGTVVVTGHRQAKPQSFPEAVAGYVRGHGAPSRIGQLTRWLDPVCPKTEGLPDAFNGFVSRRISEVAARVGAPGPGACTEDNVLVIFTTLPQTLMDNVRKDHPELLGYHFVAQAQGLAAFKGPIQAWHLTATRAPNGQAFLDEGDYQGPPGAAGSRLTNHLKSEFAFVLVVADATATANLPAGAVADHIAALALSQPASQGGCSPLPSILDSLDAACPQSAAAQSLTPYDEAYLKGLYASDPEALLAFERSTIGDRLLKATRAPPGR